MTYRAAFAQCLVLVNEFARLVAMTFRARLVYARHTDRRSHAKRGTVRSLQDLRPMGIVALHAIHPAFEHRMVLRQL